MYSTQRTFFPPILPYFSDAELFFLCCLRCNGDQQPNLKRLEGSTKNFERRRLLLRLSGEEEQFFLAREESGESYFPILPAVISPPAVDAIY